MHACPADHYHSGVVSDQHFEPVVVVITFHIENDHIACQKARRCVSALDIARRAPLRLLGIGNPVLDPRAGIGMRTHKIIQLFAPGNTHARDFPLIVLFLEIPTVVSYGTPKLVFKPMTVRER